MVRQNGCNRCGNAIYRYMQQKPTGIPSHWWLSLHIIQQFILVLACLHSTLVVHIDLRLDWNHYLWSLKPASGLSAGEISWHGHMNNYKLPMNEWSPQWNEKMSSLMLVISFGFLHKQSSWRKTPNYYWSGLAPLTLWRYTGTCIDFIFLMQSMSIPSSISHSLNPLSPLSQKILSAK